MNNDKNFNEMIDFIENSNKINKVKKKKTSKFVLLIINLLSITLLISGGIGLKIIYDKKLDYKKTEEMEQELADIYNRNSNVEPNQNGNNDLVEAPEEVPKEEYTESFNELLSINSDTVGWLKVNNTNINMPIVKSSNNNYYLTKNFKKEYSVLGWLFADYRNEFNNGLSKNTIIYGHTMKNGPGLMMSSLKNVLDNSWLNNSDNLQITFDTPNKNMKWQVFSIYTTPVTDDYLRVNFDSDADFINFTNMLKNRSIRNFGVTINGDDNIITLSTCYLNADNRLVVHAKLIK